MHSFPLSSTWRMDQEGLSTLSWRTVSVRMISSQWILNFCGTCCSSWIPTNLWGLMVFIQIPQRASWWHCKASLDDFWLVLGIQRGWLPVDWKLTNIVPVFKRARRRTLENTCLSVSLQCLVKSWKILFWDTEILKNAWRTMQPVTASMASQGENPAC